ncbi:MAG TPA: hypothetical protein VFX62_01330 [Erythrobacter sp.]|nr:hypothetical protein [Erythrobacter sp.]
MPANSPARSARIVAAALLAVLLSACASQVDAGVADEAGTPGFWWGLWHGFVFPWAWIGSLFDSEIAVYAVPNRGGWYDFGFFLGITVLGGGSWFSSKQRSG